MNENIGAKGGKRDRKRTLIITRENKKKLKEYNKKQQKLRLQKLEKKVKQQQIITFLKAIPIAVTGESIKTIVNNTKLRSESFDKEIEVLGGINQQTLSNTSNKEIKKPINNDRFIINIKTKKPINKDKSIINIKTKKPKLEEIEILDFNEEKLINKIGQPPKEDKIKPQIISKIEPQISVKIENKIKPKISKGINVDVSKKSTQYSDKKIEETTSEKEFDKIKNRKILDKYEKKLREVRSEIKQLDFEYMILEEQSDKLYTEEEANKLLGKLDILINKIYELKELIRTDNRVYDENYLQQLIKEYLEDFSDRKIISEVKDSSLYILISEKLSELDYEKNKLEKKVELKKEKLQIDNIKLNKLKEKYFEFDNVNRILSDIEKEQEAVLIDLMEKVKNSETEVEKIKYEVDAMYAESQRVLRKIAILSLIPGIRSGELIAILTAYYMYLISKAKKPYITKRVYKKIDVKDYHIDIESNIDKITDAERLLGKTTKKLQKEISKFKKEFEEYFNVIPECKKLLNNLNNILDNVERKEKEVKEIKKKQYDLLKENNQKVKKIEAPNV